MIYMLLIGGANLDVLFDGEKQKTNCHPTWEIIYFNTNGSICRDFREECK